MRIPRATYRLQFTPEFGFEAARRIIPYLKNLGISDIYASPIFAARSGSRHGYDVTDPNALNPELGRPEDFSLLMDKVRGAEMGWVQDIVPNHMAFDSSNGRLSDVLTWGPESEYAATFDIDWNHPDPRLKGKLMAPFLGRPRAECIREGEIKLIHDRRGFQFQYGGLSFPVRRQSHEWILGRVPDGAEAFRGRPKSPAGAALPKEAYDRRAVELWDLCQEIPSFKSALDRALADINAPGSDALERLLSEQHYYLTFWKESKDLINYRRFFTISDLICLRVDRADVFDDTHRRILDLCRDGFFSGLRIDHIDGLLDPASYLSRLRSRVGGEYLVVEKILNRTERLPDWPVQGTTGYDFLNLVNGLFCDPQHAKYLQSVYASFTGEESAPLKLVVSGKKKVIEEFMSGDADNLARRLAALGRGDPAHKSVRFSRWRRTLIEAVGYFPIYRTYVAGTKIDEDDARYIRRAVERARGARPDLEHELEFLRRVLMLEYPDPPGLPGAVLDFVMRFQQFTGPLMAKGFEDTALYIYNRLVSLNEVGGYPEHFGTSLPEWHDYLALARGRWPATMNATATHDTKRGEDLRARVNVLSEIPGSWRRRMARWTRINRGKKREIRGRLAPARNEEYLIYQTLLGACPAAGQYGPSFNERIKEYMVKAMREAKVHTGWINPDMEYEKAVLSFIDVILTPEPGNLFPDELGAFHSRIVDQGIINSLSQALLKITAPGIPDFYQGTELWDLSLVDPDNRQPVDYDLRIRLLDWIRRSAEEDLRALIAELWANRRDGRIKMFLIYSGLKARAAEEPLFREGAYHPLTAEGEHGERIVAFARSRKGAWSLTVAPRFMTGLSDRGAIPAGMKIWKDTRVPMPAGSPARWRDAFTNRIVGGEGFLSVGDVLSDFPVSLLIGEG